MEHLRTLRTVCMAAPFFIFSIANASSETIVKHTVGALHGFVVVRSQTGARLGYGELAESAAGDSIDVHLVYHFLDGSLDEETTTFTQGKTFQLVSDHHIQQGRFFPKPSDITVEAGGKVTTRSTDRDGKPKVETTQMELPPDISNGMVGVILSNIAADAQEFRLGLIVPGSKPRAVRLDVSPAGERPFHIAGTSRKASIFRLKIELGGVAGVVAPLLGKQPADTLVWIFEGEPPMLVRTLGPLAEGTPIVSVEIAGATFPAIATPKK